MNYRIVQIELLHINSFHQAVDSVAREKKYLAFLEGPSIDQVKQFVRNMIEEGMPHFVALDEDKVIGWCDITSFHRQSMAHSGALGIGLLADYRGQGIGKALLEKTLNQAKSQGITRIELTVREPNLPAIALYEKLGFEKEGLKKNAIYIDGVYENLICMAKLYG